MCVRFAKVRCYGLLTLAWAWSMLVWFLDRIDICFCRVVIVLVVLVFVHVHAYHLSHVYMCDCIQEFASEWLNLASEWLG